VLISYKSLKHIGEYTTKSEDQDALTMQH